MSSVEVDLLMFLFCIVWPLFFALNTSHVACSRGIMLIRVTERGWDVLFVDKAWQVQTGIANDSAIGKDFWDIFTLSPVQTDTKEDLESYMHGNNQFKVVVSCY